MKLLLPVIAVLALAGCDAGAPGEAGALTAIPKAFVGTWEIDPGACGSGSDTRVTVSETELQLPQSAVAVKKVVPDGETAVRVDGAFTGGGDTWNGSVRLELAGEQLIVVNGAMVSPRVKCR